MLRRDPAFAESYVRHNAERYTQLVAGMAQTAEGEQKQRQREPCEEERSHDEGNSNRDASSRVLLSARFFTSNRRPW